MSGDDSITGSEPAFSVATGNATDEELAALFAILQASTVTETLKAGSDRPLAGGWKSYYRTIRQSAAPGREAWRNIIRF
ncbi:MAG: acyl-CoA carboxylase subunit epsilon [Arachnia sp.]